MRSWRRPLEPSEISWIIEGKIRGTIPIRMFPRLGEDDPVQLCNACCTVSAEEPAKEGENIVGVQITSNGEISQFL
jgi:hypothetical protein